MANVDHLDQEYIKDAASTEILLSAAAWTAQELRKHLDVLTDFCDSIGTGGGDYQLIKKRRAEDI